MSNTQTYLAFCIASVILVYISVQIRNSWSRDGYSESRYRRAVAFMIFSGFVHYNHAYTGEILFSNLVDKSPLRFISFLLVFIHILSLPSPSTKPGWLSRKKKPETITLKPRKPIKRNHYEEMFFSVLKFILLVTVASVCCTGILFAIVSKIIPGSAPFTTYPIIIVFVCIATLYSISLYRSIKRRDYIL